MVRALVDTGCSTTVVKSQLVDCHIRECRMFAFDGREVKCKGKCWTELVVGEKHLEVEVVVIDEIVNGVDMVLGMDVIELLGGVTVSKGTVRFGAGHCLAAIVEDQRSDEGEGTECLIEDKDFTAKFDGRNWTVKWFWKADDPPVLKNSLTCYDKQLTGRKRVEFEKEVERWIDEGILMPWKEKVESGILPLMAVEQPTKRKVRPVLDYRELNAYVQSHTGDEMTDVCSEVMRKWRQVEGDATLVDLKSAYLQIKVASEFWKYQLVKYKGQTFCLTRLGFGLNCAPRVMAVILKTVLSKSKRIQLATSSYIDDILVDESQVSAEELVDHLNKYGLATKPPEHLDGGAALGLKLQKNERGELVFSRGNELPCTVENLTRRELFSVCGKLVGHYPLAGWLRIACSYIKRRAEGTRWDDFVGEHAMRMMKETLEEVRRADPVRGSWHVPRRDNGVVWCDASSIALGVLLEIDGCAVEDAAWLRKESDFSHINVAELEAILKGVNLALKWGLKEINVMTDSATVHGWVKVALAEERRIRTKGAAEMIIKRRLGILKNLSEEFDLRIAITFVPTLKNKADALTRVKKGWLATKEEDPVLGKAAMCAAAVDLKEIHGMHHVGVDRTLFLARKIDPTITRRAVQQVVRGCERCQMIDPAPVVHHRGELGVRENWKRLAVDVTHYRQVAYLSIIDCGPGRLAIWKELKRESAECIASVVDNLFLERGPADELLLDNATVFRSEALGKVLSKWNVQRFFRAAYRPEGNGIIERHHRTIKTMAERGGISPLQAVFWYNMSPRSGQDEQSVPQRSIFRYDWRHPAAAPPKVGEEKAASVKLGEEVWVKPAHARCTSHWQKGVITGINSQSNVSVDNMPRHILDVRKVVHPHESEERNEEEQEMFGARRIMHPPEDEEESEEEAPQDEDVEVEIADDCEQRYPQRVRRPPLWMEDYVTELSSNLDESFGVQD